VHAPPADYILPQLPKRQLQLRFFLATEIPKTFVFLARIFANQAKPTFFGLNQVWFLFCVIICWRLVFLEIMGAPACVRGFMSWWYKDELIDEILRGEDPYEKSPPNQNRREAQHCKCWPRSSSRASADHSFSVFWYTSTSPYWSCVPKMSAVANHQSSDFRFHGQQLPGLGPWKFRSKKSM